MARPVFILIVRVQVLQLRCNYVSLGDLANSFVRVKTRVSGSDN